VDTVGSGDAFLAGFVHAFLNGKSTPNCLELASIMGALVASKMGATPTIRMEEVEKLMYG
jgi:sugar/nucleoside kinase (ribokinase family)